ncbi:hypothetical protein M885DRAFT_524834 [Pelagophyceae sp. CCMP2097]|nr:hypothetical protein M885DRAFT_524834 [Pelagophyceae sp. CCMP2097]
MEALAEDCRVACTDAVRRLRIRLLALSNGERAVLALVVCATVFGSAYGLVKKTPPSRAAPREKCTELQAAPELFSSLPPAVLKTIESVREAGGAMSPTQYKYVAGLVSGRRMLVFAGPADRDSALWHDVSKATFLLDAKGAFDFSEKHKDEWNVVHRRYPDLDMRPVKYLRGHHEATVVLAKLAAFESGKTIDKTTDVTEADVEESIESIKMKLPKDLEEECWDALVVDGPYGEGPGRIESLVTAAALKRRLAADPRCAAQRREAGHAWIDVFVHDADRDTERSFSELLFGHEAGAVCTSIKWLDTELPRPTKGDAALHHFRFADAPAPPHSDAPIVTPAAPAA